MGKMDILIKFVGNDLVTDILKQMKNQASETKKANEEVTQPLEKFNPTGLNKINEMLKGVSEKASQTSSNVTNSLDKINNLDFTKIYSKYKSATDKIVSDAKNGAEGVLTNLNKINILSFEGIVNKFKSAIGQMTNDAKSGTSSIGSSFSNMDSITALASATGGYMGLNQLFEEGHQKTMLQWRLGNTNSQGEASAITNAFKNYDISSARSDSDLTTMMNLLTNSRDLNSSNTSRSLAVLDAISADADPLRQRGSMYGFGSYLASGYDSAAGKLRDEGLSESQIDRLKSAKTYQERLNAVQEIGIEKGKLQVDAAGNVTGAYNTMEGELGGYNRALAIFDQILQSATDAFMGLMNIINPLLTAIQGAPEWIWKVAGYGIIFVGILAALGGAFQILKATLSPVFSILSKIPGLGNLMPNKNIAANHVTVNGKTVNNGGSKGNKKTTENYDPNSKKDKWNRSNSGGSVGEPMKNKKGVGARIKQKVKSITGTITSGANNASKKVKNTANSASSFITSKFSGAGNRVKNTLNGVGTTAGAMGTKIKSGATRGIGGLKNLGGTLKTQIIGGFKSAGGVIKTAISNLRNFSGAAVTARARSIALGTAEKLRGVWTAITTGITKGATIAQRALNLALSTNPIGAVITVVMILVGALIYLWTTNEGFRKAVINGWNAIRNGVQSAIHIIMGGLDWLIGGLNAVLTPLRQIWCMVMGCSPGLIPAFKKFGNVVPGDINKVGSSLKGLHNKMSKMPESLEMNATASSKIDKSVMKNKNKKGSSNGGSGDSKDGGDVHYHKHENTFEFKDKSKEEVKKILIEIFEDGDKTPMI